MGSIKSIKLLLALALGMLLFMWACDSLVNTNSRKTELKIEQVPFPSYIQPHAQAFQKATGQLPKNYCYVSTLNATGAENAYTYRAFRINLPQGLLDQAEKQDQQIAWVTFRYGSRHALLRVEADTAALGKGGIVRMARCRIPQSKKIVEVLFEQFTEFGKASWISQYKSTLTDSKSKDFARVASEWVKRCIDWGSYCTAAGDDDRCDDPDNWTPYCKQYSWIFVVDGDNGGGGLDGGEGVGGGGNDSDPCAPCQPHMPCSNRGGTPGGCAAPGGGDLDPLDPDDPGEPEPCETGGKYPALDAEIVQQAMDEAWLESYGSSDNPLDDDQRNEALFLVYSTNNGYSIEVVPAGPETSSCHFDGGNYTITSNIVALIHVHPYSDGDTVNDPACGSGTYDGDVVSEEDRSVVQEINSSTVIPPTPMFVIDKDKIRIIKPTNPYQYSNTIGRCGY